jgi:ECF sigma factor
MRQNPVRTQLVKLRFFGGMTMPEIASALGVSLATAERYWVFARAWLCAELADPESPLCDKKRLPGEGFQVDISHVLPGPT